MARQTEPGHDPQDSPEATHSFRRKLRLSGLNRARVHAVDETATVEEQASVAEFLGLQGLRKLRIAGALSPTGADGWRFEGQLGATATQSCVVTLQPVRTRVDVELRRIYLPDIDLARTSTEVEMDPDADEVEPLPDTLDLGALAVEELALALPAYPRAEDAPELALEARPRGAAPIEPAPRPFAALEALKAKLERDED
ncbi:DUF177 domain-containing protein [Halovulum dunhuangense]|uniref:DUF177 domain-containing protein n=1 Tax=Halovulum dunhuangense TaxID=1505036 RepID=A0A849L1Q4_9RHOB|nr:DUF177 domain-containing protein [Halovulum dunhuangense]NNU80226.1 DUF177 domain-containing protein [Halovulum dunhuangense]